MSSKSILSNVVTPEFVPRGLTILQAAKYSGLKVWTIRNLIWDRKIAYLQEGKHYIILRDVLDHYLEEAQYKVRA